MHELQPRYTLNRRQLVGATLGAIVAAQVPKVISAPEITPEHLIVVPEKEFISQAEINELEANLYDTARENGFSLAPKEDIYEALYQVERAHTESEAISVVSAFTEHQYGFPVNNLTYDDNNLKSGLREKKLLSNLSLLPKEVYEAINLGNFDIGTPPLGYPINEFFAGSFVTYPNSNTITLLPEYAGSSDIWLHEVSHGVDYMAMLGDGDEASRLAADAYLNGGRESEDTADLATRWMMGYQEGAYTGLQLNELQERYESVVPGIVPYVEQALRPYIQAVLNSEKNFFFQPAEADSK